MIKAKEYYRTSDGTHFDEIKELALSNTLNGWEEYYWAGVYLYKYAPNGTYSELIVEVLEESFFEGLTYLSEKDCYLDAVKILGRLYLETQQYDLALNMLQMLMIKDTNVPDWVYLRFIYAQMHSDTAQRLVDEPWYFFEKLDRNDQTNKDSVSQRNAIFQEFLYVCIKHFKNDSAKTDTGLMFEKAMEYQLLHTEAWKEFSSYFPDDFELTMPVDVEEIEEDDDNELLSIESISASMLADLEEKNEILMQKIHALQEEMGELLRKNQDYEQLLEEKKAVIQQLTDNDAQIDSINKSIQYGKDTGHNLIGGRKKILVIGNAEAPTDKLRGLAKSYGYKKDDFVFWDDYNKIKSYAERMDSGSLSFIGIIAGPMPHKVSNLGDHSSLIEKMKQPGYPHMEEARSESGELKLTKNSFKKALERMTQHLLAIQ